MTSSTYNNSIPQPTDQISQSQPPILTNFFQANALFAVDHVAWNSPTSTIRGQHAKITFNAPLTMDPNLAGPTASLYTKTVTNSELFFQNGTMASNVAQLTNLPITSTTDGSGNTIFTVKSPWGITFYLGQTPSFSGSRSVNFPTSFSALYCAVGSSASGSAAVGVASSLSGVLISVSSTVSVNFIAIGKV